MTWRNRILERRRETAAARRLRAGAKPRRKGRDLIRKRERERLRYRLLHPITTCRQMTASAGKYIAYHNPLRWKSQEDASGALQWALFNHRLRF